jgi:predicted O-methyltransferase YrrM
LRITLLNHTSMHLDQVEVYGTVESEDAVGGDPVFTSDWFSALGAVWRDIFRSQSWDSSKPKTIVELGCFEGRATLWILENLLMNPASRLHCVDVFPDDDKPETYGARHRRNVRTSPRANMVTRHAVYSYDFLLDFVHKGGKADFIYIDASHRSPEVLEDLILAFQALNVGGVIICDDYLGGAPDPKSEGILSTPKMAIDVFTTLFRDRLQILRGQPLYQMAFIKTAGRGRDDPSSRGWS